MNLNHKWVLYGVTHRYHTSQQPILTLCLHLCHLRLAYASFTWNLISNNSKIGKLLANSGCFSREFVLELVPFQTLSVDPACISTVFFQPASSTRGVECTVPQLLWFIGKKTAISGFKPFYFCSKCSERFDILTIHKHRSSFLLAEKLKKCHSQVTQYPPLPYHHIYI